MRQCRLSLSLNTIGWGDGGRSGLLASLNPLPVALLERRVSRSLLVGFSEEGRAFDMFLWW